MWSGAASEQLGPAGAVRDHPRCEEDQMKLAIFPGAGNPAKDLYSKVYALIGEEAKKRG